MKRPNGRALVDMTPLLALLAATGMSLPSMELDFGRAHETIPGGSDLSVGIKPASYRFTQHDIEPLVAALSHAGITNFVCWINPTTGALDVVTAEDSKPHLDIKPGKCPNNLDVNGDDDDDHDGDDGDDDDDDGDHGGGDHGDDDCAHAGHAAAVFATHMNVGLLGNAFDVTQLDVPSVRLSLVDTLVAGGELAPVDATFLDVGTPFVGTECHCTSAGPDGILDLSMLFDQQAMIDTFGLDSFPNHTQVPLKATGMLIGGRAIFGTRDCLRIINN